MSGHSLERTSPKGGPFFGTCTKCGTKDLPVTAVGKPCANPANITDDEALIMAIKGPIASGTEAQSVKTACGLDPKDDGPAPKGDAQSLSDRAADRRERGE